MFLSNISLHFYSLTEFQRQLHLFSHMGAATTPPRFPSIVPQKLFHNYVSKAEPAYLLFTSVQWNGRVKCLLKSPMASNLLSEELHIYKCTVQYI
jgi:hypothetical protein